MATIVKQPMIAVTVMHGEAMPVRTFLEAASQTFKQGSPVVINAGGQVAEIGADPTKIDGVALSDATGVTDAEIQVVLPLPAVIFQANISGVGTSDQSDVGDQRGIVKDNDNWHIDESEIANPVVEITGLRSDAGDINGIVYFKFLSTVALPLIDASNVANVADVDVEGGIPLIFRILAAALTGDIDVVMEHKVRVVDVKARAVGGAGGAADTITVKNTASAISDAIDMNVADNITVLAATIDDATAEIAAGGILRITGASAVNAQVYVTAIRVA